MLAPCTPASHDRLERHHRRVQFGQPRRHRDSSGASAQQRDHQRGGVLELELALELSHLLLTPLVLERERRQRELCLAQLGFDVEPRLCGS